MIKILKKWQIKLKTSKKHCAFTDLCHWKNNLYCCFREAKDHLSGDGKIQVFTLDLKGQILSKAQFRLANTDLRDPKLSITPDGKLLLLGYARQVNDDNKTLVTQAVCWVSGDGQSWSSPHLMPIKNQWLWRIRWHRDTAYGFAYHRGNQRLNLFKGDPRRSFNLHQSNVLSHRTHGLGYPNESDLLFQADGSAWAIVRRDADSFTAQLGKAKPPYKHWQWFDLGQYIGGPAMLSWDENSALIAGRQWTEKGAKTAIWHLCLIQKKLALFDVLPSSGDTSYPGLVKTENGFMLSYYSSHTDNHSGIYLACYE